jgi:hypothetical protein
MAGGGRLARVTRFDETWHRLKEWTGGSTASERLAAQVLLDLGYENVDPIHPLGGPDGGKDAFVERQGTRWIMAVYFPRGQKDLRDITKKFESDFLGVAKNQADGMVFVTNQELTESERRGLTEAVDGSVDIVHIEKVVAVLDQPHMAGVRKQFLDIDFAPSVGLAPAERLAEMRRESVARCVQRWRGVGLPQQEAGALAEDHAVGLPVRELAPGEGRPVVVWTGKIGAGKSIAAERVHQAAIDFAREESSAPVPVFLHASEIDGDLASAVADKGNEVGDPRTRGAAVVIDALDEVGYEAAEAVLGQARVLAETWPATTVLLTSRPLPGALDVEEHVEIPTLSEAESHACIEIGAGRAVHYGEVFGFPETVKQTLRQPFFALLAGLWLRENTGSPRAPIDLMAELGERATPEGADRSVLRRLAIRSVARDLGPVPTAEILRPAEVNGLLATGIVAGDKLHLTFALPSLAQWFAAEALLERDINVSDLLAVPEDLELWLYPLALAIGFGSFEDGGLILQPLLEGEAGFAFRVLDTAFKQAVLEGEDAPPWREAGEMTRDSLTSLREALAPLGPLITDSDDDGRLAPMAVASDDGYLTVAFATDRGRPDVFQLPADFDMLRAGFEWGSIRGSRVGPGGTWAWRWSRDAIKDGIKRLLKGRGFPVSPDGPLGDEEAWACAARLVGRSPFACPQIEVTPLIDQIVATLPPDLEATFIAADSPSGQRGDLVGMLSYLLRLRSEGHEHLKPPIPAPDRLEGGGGWIGEFYSDERLLAAAEAIYLQSIQAYGEIVDRWLPSLAPTLERRVLMPVRVVGRIRRGPGSGFESIPTAAGHLEALAFDKESQVSFVLDPKNYDYSLAEGNWEAQKLARPMAKRWLRGIHGGLTFEVGQERPVTDVVYDWLVSDLGRLGLADPLDKGASNQAMTPWDLDPRRSWKDLVIASRID